MSILFIAHRPSLKYDDVVLLEFIQQFVSEHRSIMVSLCVIHTSLSYEKHTISIVDGASKGRLKHGFTIDELRQSVFIKYDLIVTLGNPDAYYYLHKKITKKCANIHWAFGDSALCRYIRIMDYGSDEDFVYRQAARFLDYTESDINLITEYSSLYWRFQLPYGNILQVQQWSNIDVLIFLTSSVGSFSIIPNCVERKALWTYAIAAVTKFTSKNSKIGVIVTRPYEQDLFKTIVLQSRQINPNAVWLFANLPQNCYQLRLWLQERSKIIITNEIGVAVDSCLLKKKTIQLPTNSWLYRNIITFIDEQSCNPEFIILENDCLKYVKSLFTKLSSRNQIIENTKQSFENHILRMIGKQTCCNNTVSFNSDKNLLEAFPTYQRNKIMDLESESYKTLYFKAKAGFYRSKRKLLKLIYSPKSFIRDSFIGQKLSQSREEQYLALKGFISNTCKVANLLIFSVLNQFIRVLLFRNYLQEYSHYLKLVSNWRTGRWTEEIINQALKLVESHASKRNIKFVINFIRDARGENRVLNELLDVQQRLVNPSVLALMGSYYLVNGHERHALRCCQICCEAKPNTVKKYLALSVFAAKKGVRISKTLRSTLKSREDILYKAEEFLKINEEIINNRTIAIVGNAAVEVGRGMGKVIDMHDLVVRFNNFSLEGQFSQDYGSKTHIWVRSPSIKEVKYTPLEGLKCIIISGYPVLHRPTMMWNWLGQPVREKMRFAFFPMKTYHELCKRLSAPPSAGMQFIYSLYKLRANMQGVSLYGFDFNQNTVYQYFSKAKASDRHNWALEYKLYREIAEVGGETIPGFASKAGRVVSRGAANARSWKFTWE